jgi:hypothetical protein
LGKEERKEYAYEALERIIELVDNEKTLKVGTS